jgi:hypothetical protein
MSMQTTPKPSGSPHRHEAVTLHVLTQRRGIPYEVEQKVCSACSRILDERPLKRVAA